MKFLLTTWLLSSFVLSAGTLKFDQTTQEIRAEIDARTVTADFNFKNETSEDVIIERYEAGCTCINTQVMGGKLAYKPGEIGTIRAAFDTSLLSGTVDKSIVLWLKGDPATKPSTTLTTRVIIPVLIEVEPKTLVWEIDSKPEPKTVILTMKHTAPIKVLSVSSSTDDRFAHELRTIEEGKKYEVIVTPLDTQKVGMAVIHVETDCPIARHRSQRIFTVVRRPQPNAEQVIAKP
jgi:hypothetical protein